MRKPEGSFRVRRASPAEGKSLAVAIDSNTPVWPATLPVPLRSHRSTGEFQYYRTEMDSGLIRKRRVALEPRKGVQVTWNFTQDQYRTFKAFFEDTLKNGSISFLMLMFGIEHELEFRDSSYSFNRSDNLYSVNADLLMISLLES